MRPLGSCHCPAFGGHVLLGDILYGRVADGLGGGVRCFCR